MSAVIVLGAGPAGAIASRLLASWGHHVTLVARGTGGERALAESIPPSGVQLLDRVGVLHAVDGGGFVRATGNTVRWGGDADAGERVETFPPGTHGFQVDRARFDALLLGEAVTAGVRVLPDTSALRVEGVGEARRVVVQDASGPRALDASWVLDCTGRAGVLAKQGWRRPQAGARTIALTQVVERDDAWPIPDQTHTVVESFDGGWAWSVPATLARRFVTVMLDPAVTVLGTRDQLDAVHRAQIARTRTMRALVEGARRVGDPFAREASPYDARCYAERGALLVGDAGSFVDPLSSFGIKKALASAWLAAVAVRSCLGDPTITDAALALFDARERAMYDALSRAAARLARAARPDDGTGFWQARAALDSAADAVDEEPDAAALRADADVQRALAELRRRDTVRLRPSPRLRRERRATVRGNRVVNVEHLVVPAFPRGIRYVRNVDLVALTDLAPSHDQVPDLFDAYNRGASPCPLPDFLGALSLLLGKDALVLA